MEPLTLDSITCKSLDQSSTKEWLETNGLGGFSSSSISGANTRRYHGLLVAATHPPVERVVMLSKLEETVHFAGNNYDLSTNFFQGAIHPHGYNLLRTFSRGIFPVWEFELPGVSITKTIGMLHGENTVVIHYEVMKADAPFVLQLRPMIAARDYHALTRRNDALYTNATFAGNVLSLRPYEGMPQLKINVPGSSFVSKPDWYHNFEYPVERSRGFDSEEDLFTPGLIEVSLKKGSSLAVVATTEITAIKEGKRALAKEAERREKLIALLPTKDPVAATLALAADQFLVKRGRDGLTIIAGYPWFTDWGRDTMIALPGLTLATSRFAEARKILKTFLASVDQGMIPNLFPDGNNPPLYNTVDATLWLFIALYSYLQHSGDDEFIQQEALPVLRDIIRWHQKGTRYGIHEDSDALLTTTDRTVQLTWMDAKIGDWVVTPRAGKPVEIQALWYNAHKIMSRWTEGSEAAEFEARSKKIELSFQEKFWNNTLGYFSDCIDGTVVDLKLRPNQIFALSLPFPLATPEQGSTVLAKFAEKLYTPRGIRTLSPDDPLYKGRYHGKSHERDSAYHQGTAWAWLLGPYIAALQKFGGVGAPSRARQIVDTFIPHHLEECIGSISEIFDAESPHRSRGAFAQAWSVGEILNAYIATHQESTSTP